MNFKNSATGWNASKGYWMKSVREAMARRLLRIGHRSANLAEFIAPWLKQERG